MAQGMETRYHYFQGQNPENTKISDRMHALHITGGAWKKINTHLDRKKLARELIEKEERHKAYLNDGSKAMIKNWANSLENIRKRKDEERAQAIENEKVERGKKFHELRKEQEEIRKAFVEKANRNIFMNKGNAKQLTSAFIMSEVFYEREKQLEFKKFLAKHEEEETAKEVENIRKIAAEAAAEEKEEREKDKKKRQEMGEYIRKELEEKYQKEKEKAEKQRLREERERADALDEIKCVDQKNLETKLKKKEELRKLMLSLLEAEKQKKVLLETEEQELDDVVRAYRTAKERIDCRKKLREKEIRDEAIEIRTKMAEKARAAQQLQEGKDEEILQKAMEEYDELAKQKELEKAQKLAEEARDKVENYKEHLKKEEVRLNREAELRKWEMLNRYKTADAIEKFKRDAEIERKNKVLKYRADLLEQMAENKAIKKKEEEMDRILIEAMDKTDDDKFFAYADEILTQERKTGRSTYPTERAIIGYKKNFNILSNPDTNTHLESYKTPQDRNAVDICKQYANEVRHRRKCKCRISLQ